MQNPSVDRLGQWGRPWLYRGALCPCTPHPLGQGRGTAESPRVGPCGPARVTHGGGDGEVPITPGLGQGFSN